MSGAVSRESVAGSRDQGRPVHGSRFTAHAPGFTLVGVVVAIAILVILIAAVGPSIATIVQRDREAELVFRGKQYARAILAFQRRYGRLPNELKELGTVHPRSIRQLWKEPACNCDDWQVILAGSPEAIPMGQAISPGGGLEGPGEGARMPVPPGNQPPSTYTGFFPPTPPPFTGGGSAPTPTPSSIFGSGETKTVGPIVGVRSKVHKKALRPWRQREFYDEWRFIAGDADNDLQNPIASNPLHAAPPLMPSPLGRR